MLREDLEVLKVEELCKICKDNNVSFYENSRRLNKTQMIEKLLSLTWPREVEVSEETDDKAVEVTTKKSNTISITVKRQIKVRTPEEEAERLAAKMKYIENAKVGSIVAFKLSNGKVISAAIQKKSTPRKKFMVVTKYGAEFKIDFDDVLWVRTNKRWPKGVYQLFKKNLTKEVVENGKENATVDNN